MRTFILVCAIAILATGSQRLHAQAEAGSPPETLADLNETPYPGVEVPMALQKAVVRQATAGRLPFESRGVWGMSPHSETKHIEGALEKAALPDLDGPVDATWQSVADHYEVPDWMYDGKFGIFLHFGLYSVPAHHNEWYEKHMYSTRGIRDWHIEKYGPLDKFGYKDFIPMFTLPNFDPDEWAQLFKDGGASFVMPSAEHHDGYSLWDSAVNPFNTVKTGPHRDVIGELAAATRARAMKFGVTNHQIEHYDFIETDKIPAGMATDLDTPGYEDFYWTQHSDERLTQHLANWLTRNKELIDQYQPDLIWYDNGINHRIFDPLKLNVAQYYFNRAREWGKQVTFTSKGTGFMAGRLQDYEKIDRAPREKMDFIWFSHDNIGDTWGFTEGMGVREPRSVINTLVDVIAKNGIFSLNLSPKGDGSIPEDQQRTLRGVGKWLKINGEAIYRSRPWVQWAEGRGRDAIRFTQRDGSLYAIFDNWPGDRKLKITLLPQGGEHGAPVRVRLVETMQALEFAQSPDGLEVTLPEQAPQFPPFVIRIEGLNLL